MVSPKDGACCWFLEYDHEQFQKEWYPEGFDQAAEFSNNVWSYDDFVETFEPERHNQLTMLC